MNDFFSPVTIRQSAELTIPQILRQTAQLFPGRLAILAPEREPITYDRLIEHIDRVASYLRACGVQRNDSIAVVLPNGPAMAIAFLACRDMLLSARR